MRNHDLECSIIVFISLLPQLITHFLFNYNVHRLESLFGADLKINEEILIHSSLDYPQLTSPTTQTCQLWHLLIKLDVNRRCSRSKQKRIKMKRNHDCECFITPRHLSFIPERALIFFSMLCSYYENSSKRDVQ